MLLAIEERAASNSTCLTCYDSTGNISALVKADISTVDVVAAYEYDPLRKPDPADRVLFQNEQVHLFHKTVDAQ